MSSQPTDDLAPRAWEEPEPDRDAVVGVFGKELLLGVVLIAIVLALWTFTAGPRLVNSGADVTTTPPSVVSEQAQVAATP